MVLEAKQARGRYLDGRLVAAKCLALWGGVLRLEVPGRYIYGTMGGGGGGGVLRLEVPGHYMYGTCGGAMPEGTGPLYVWHYAVPEGAAMGGRG